MTLTYGTTLYRPADGCHVYAHDAVEPTPNEPCAECQGNPWDAVHQLVEEHTSLLPAERPRYCVEVSTTNGRDWATNGLRWPNAEDARRWGSGLSLRWFATTDIVVVECDATGEPTATVVERVLGEAPFAL